MGGMRAKKNSSRNKKRFDEVLYGWQKGHKSGRLGNTYGCAYC